MLAASSDRHDQQIGLALQPRVGEQALAQRLRTRRCRRASRLRPRAPVALQDQAQGAAHLARACRRWRCRNWNATAAPPWARCRSGARTSAASTVISAISSSVGSRLDLGIGEEERAGLQDQRGHGRTKACTLGRRADARRSHAPDARGSGRPCRRSWRRPRRASPSARRSRCCACARWSRASSGVTPLRSVRL